MSSSTHQQSRRSDTRQRIQDVALELFADQGYEKTSLREIAERLDVTKAALYYHFKTKEDILISIAQDRTRSLDELIAWAEGQPHEVETAREVLRRYAVALEEAAPLFRFVHENQAAVRVLRINANLKERSVALVNAMAPKDPSVTDHVRCLSALFTLHSVAFAMIQLPGDVAEQREAALTVAFELVTAAHGGAQGGAEL